MVLLDTDVMIDILRKHQPALAWLDSLEKETIGIPGLVARSRGRMTISRLSISAATWASWTC
jgi:predicted nucleic acid-binding protein